MTAVASGRTVGIMVTTRTVEQAGAGRRQRVVALCIGAVVAQVLFVGAALVVGALEGHGYQAARHDVSDLGALTAHHVAIWLPVMGITGALTMAFAIGALRPALSRPDLGPPMSAWLVAVSLPALDNLGDAFFRLDCRIADAGCTAAASTASWHGKMHYAVFFLAAIPTLIAPFALARRMARLTEWIDLAPAVRRFGFLVIAGFVVTLATTDTGVQGWTQRGLIAIVCGGIVALALQVVRRPATPPRG
jgi:uncharacterized protein DUF998